MKFDLYFLFLTVGAFELAFGHNVIAPSLLPRTQENSRAKTFPKARPQFRKDVMSRPLPELKRVNSGPGHPSDPKALALMKAEQNAKAVRKETRGQEATTGSEIDRRISEYNSLPLARFGGASVRYLHATQTRDMLFELGGQRTKLVGAYMKAGEAAMGAGRLDRAMRNTKKAQANTALAEVSLSQGQATASHAASRNLPSIVRTSRLLGVPSIDLDDLNRQAAKGREEYQGHQLKAQENLAKYRQLRAAGGKDTDSD